MVSTEFLEFMMYRLSQGADFIGMPENGVQNLFSDMWVYVNGFANINCECIQKEKNDTFIIENFARVGATIITSYAGEFEKMKIFM